MNLKTTLIGREIVVAALAMHKDLALQQGAISRRLRMSEKEAKDQLSTNKWLVGAFGSVDVGETGPVTVDIPTNASAQVLHCSLGLWAASATKKNDNVHQITLMTDVDERKQHAQAMADQLSEQLSLPVTDISSLDAKPAAPKAAELNLEKPAGKKKGSDK